MRDPNDWPEDMPQDIRDAIQRGMDSAEAEYNAITKDAERYRKMLPLIGVPCPSLQILWDIMEIRSGEELTELLDSMEAADAKPE